MRLGLVPLEPPARPHPVIRAALSTGRTAWVGLIWVGVAALWFSVVAQVFVVEFLNHQPVVGWMNQPLVHVPSLHFTAAVEPAFMEPPGPLTP
jgi:hypothetical protein